LKNFNKKNQREELLEGEWDMKMSLYDEYGLILFPELQTRKPVIRWYIRQD